MKVCRLLQIAMVGLLLVSGCTRTTSPSAALKAPSPKGGGPAPFVVGAFSAGSAAINDQPSQILLVWGFNVLVTDDQPVRILDAKLGEYQDGVVLRNAYLSRSNGKSFGGIAYGEATSQMDWINSAKLFPLPSPQGLEVLPLRKALILPGSSLYPPATMFVFEVVLAPGRVDGASATVKIDYISRGEKGQLELPIGFELCSSELDSDGVKVVSDCNKFSEAQHREQGKIPPTPELEAPPTPELEAEASWFYSPISEQQPPRRTNHR